MRARRVHGRVTSRDAAWAGGVAPGPGTARGAAGSAMSMQRPWSRRGRRHGGQAAAARPHGPGGPVPEVRSPQPSGFMPGHKERGPSGLVARPGDPFAGSFGDSPAGRLSAHLARQLRSRTATGWASRRSLTERKRRTDLRLALPALMVWGTAVAGNWWSPAALAVLCAGMATAAGILLLSAGRKKAKRNNAKRIKAGRVQPGRIRRSGFSRAGSG